MSEVIKPRSNKKDKIVRALELEEQQQITDYLIGKTIQECPYRNAFLMQMYMGLRIGEVLALKNSDINLKNNILRVDKIYLEQKNNLVRHWKDDENGFNDRRTVSWKYEKT